MSIFVIKA